MSLQKAAEKRFGTKPTIKTGKRGDMTVFVNGRNVFGYKSEGTMPATDVLIGRIEAAQT